ncbi:MAG: hypothetical protein EOP42_10620 [Sphingobacteriaceae bacterium]|nr:MAG: hypothetical protein EOP42_10620 [Sphingobacteriaceae bacterium]
MKLYRAVSEEEMNDFILDKQFRTSKNTLEAKQFFKLKTNCIDFVKKAVLQEYNPQYKHLLTIEINEHFLQNSDYFNSLLDGYDAISIGEDDLLKFNYNVKFVLNERL